MTSRTLRGLERGYWCPFPKMGVPAPGEVGLGFKATCRCGKRVSVTVRGLFARHAAALKGKKGRKP